MTQSDVKCIKSKKTEKYFILQLFVLIILNISRNSHGFKAHFSVALRQRMNNFSLWKHYIPLPTHRDSLEHRSKSNLCDYAKVCLLKVTDFSRFMLGMLSKETSVHKLINSRDIRDRSTFINKISSSKGQKFSKAYNQ